jgi:ribonuclease P protein component
VSISSSGLKASGLAASGARHNDWPKTARLLRRPDFDRVYKTGRRFGSPLFTAFLVQRPEDAAGSRAGFTTPRGLGKAVVRNRIRRRLREVVRLHWAELAPGWDLVFNPRRALLDAPTSGIEGEVHRLFGNIAAAPSSNEEKALKRKS